jgi:phage gp45-like
MTLQAVARMVKNMLGRALVNLVNDAPGIQTMQIDLLAEETHNTVERYQNYGFSSVPLTGAEAVALCVGGNRDHPIVIVADDRRYRKKGLLPGDVSIYTATGIYITLHNATGAISIFAATGGVSVEGNLTVTGDIHATGNVSDGVRSMEADRDIYNIHRHPETGSTTNVPNQQQ